MVGTINLKLCCVIRKPYVSAPILAEKTQSFQRATLAAPEMQTVSDDDHDHENEAPSPRTNKVKRKAG